MCSHREPVYTGREPWSCGVGPGDCDCPPGNCLRLLESEKAQDQSILLPLYHQLTNEDQDRVAEALGQACRNP
jgi:perosamine synthetase